MTIYDKYEAVIGLEIHAQLMTKSKIFTSDATTFGAEPNTHINPITLALPGTLPKLNKDVVDMAIKMGIACNCCITEINHFARKNYFYADLPKGYQISQDKTPICVGGGLEILVDGNKKFIELNRIHLEEDAGKNNHELDENYSMIDLNRAGVPLIEIVSEPCIHSSDEAYIYLTEIRKLVRYLDVCDGNMEEGSMRCDANISIRLKGENILNTRVEVKNMNSIRNVKKAIDNEIKRQIDLVENGGTVYQETRSFVPADGSTFVLRSKEFAHDYRYFPEPDLPPLVINKSKIDAVKNTMPLLPKALIFKFTNDYNLSEYDAQVLTDEKETALYFIEILHHTKNYKAAANWMINEIKSYLNENHLHLDKFTLQPKQIAEIIAAVDSNQLSLSGAKTVFQNLISNPNKTVIKIAEELNLIQSSDEDELQNWAKIVIEKYPEKVKEYKGGKKGILAMFMGEVMKQSKGKADPKMTNKILEELLKN